MYASGRGTPVAGTTLSLLDGRARPWMPAASSTIRHSRDKLTLGIRLLQGFVHQLHSDPACPSGGDYLTPHRVDGALGRITLRGYSADHSVPPASRRFTAASRFRPARLAAMPFRVRTQVGELRLQSSRRRHIGTDTFTHIWHTYYIHLMRTAPTPVEPRSSTIPNPANAITAVLSGFFLLAKWGNSFSFTGWPEPFESFVWRQQHDNGWAGMGLQSPQSTRKRFCPLTSCRCTPTSYRALATGIERVVIAIATPGCCHPARIWIVLRAHKPLPGFSAKYGEIHGDGVGQRLSAIAESATTGAERWIFARMPRQRICARKVAGDGIRAGSNPWTASPLLSA